MMPPVSAPTRQTLKQQHVAHIRVLNRGIHLIVPNLVFSQGWAPLFLQSQVSPGSVPTLVSGLEGVLGAGWPGFLGQTPGP